MDVALPNRTEDEDPHAPNLWQFAPPKIATLTGDMFVGADLRLFPTLYRHDPIYYLRMKLNGAKVLDFPNLWGWLCRVCALDGVAGSGSMVHRGQGNFGRTGNGVIPFGPFRPMAYPEAYDHPELAREG